jgi:hypothetical protein
MAEATKTGAPARRKPAAATKPTTAATKAAPAKAAQKPAAATKTTAKAPAAPAAQKPAEETEGTTRELVEFEFVNETKSYNVFQPPANSGCVGKFYAPHGTLEVKALLIMDAEAAE